MAQVLSNTPSQLVAIVFSKTLFLNFTGTISCQLILKPGQSYVLATEEAQVLCNKAKSVVAWFDSPRPHESLTVIFFGKTTQYLDDGALHIFGVHQGEAGAIEDVSSKGVCQAVIAWLASHGVT